MKEHPIIFNSEMVRAILDERKSQTRRVIKPQPIELNEKNFGFFVGQYEKAIKIKDTWAWQTKKWRPNKNGAFRQVISKPFKCPYGKVGDRIWVRETWDFRPMPGACAKNRIVIIGYKADGTTKAVEVPQESNPTVHRKLRSPIFMPKWAARIWLEITGIRVERVQDITWQDCKAEGITLIGDELVFNNKKQKQSLMKTKFKRLWDSLNAKRGYGWDKNPWCWCISFRRIEIAK